MNTKLRVRTRFPASASVAEFVLEDPAGTDLPSWEPGAHVTLHLPNGLERQYSLCGDPVDRSGYRIGVLREPVGRGGSAWIHDHLHEGDLLAVTGPRNHFGLVGGPRYHFVAAGIGITPILPMVRACQARQADWRLTYLGRSRDTMAFLDEVTDHGDRVHVHADDESGLAALGKILQPVTDGDLVYACGPEGLLRGVDDVMANHPGATLHVERFSPKDPGVLDEDGAAFTVAFARSGVVAEVPPGTSILDVAERHGITADYSCREGTCGTCEVAVLAGRPDHRDSVLSPDEQESSDTMLPCVSRSLTPRLDIDL